MRTSLRRDLCSFFGPSSVKQDWVLYGLAFVLLIVSAGCGTSNGFNPNNVTCSKGIERRTYNLTSRHGGRSLPCAPYHVLRQFVMRATLTFRNPNKCPDVPAVASGKPPLSRFTLETNRSGRTTGETISHTGREGTILG